MIFTTSEIMTYLRCRKKWDYTSHNRQSLEKVQAPRSALNIGSLVHKGLELQLMGDPVPHQTVLDIARSEMQDSEQLYLEAVGMGWSEEEHESAKADAALASGMVQHHHIYYGTPAFPGMEVLAAELSFRVPIPGTQNELAGTFDALAKDTKGQIWIIDHKTFSRSPRRSFMENSWQFRAYMWAADKLFDEPVGGFVYNGLKKALPKPPPLLKSGKLSTSETSLKASTAESFRATILLHGHDPNDYKEALTILTQRKNHFFHREEIHMSLPRQARFAEDLRSITSEMAMPQPLIVPNFRWEGCGDCSMQSLCDASENDDLAPMGRFRKGTYGTASALELTPQAVSRLEDLLE